MPFNPRDLSLVTHAFAVRKNRSWLDRAIETVVMWCLWRGWLRFKVIPTPDYDAYMLRVYLSPGGTQKNPHRFVALFLHYIFEPDFDRGLHSHPYPWFLAMPLTAGYREVRMREGENVARMRAIRPWRFNWTTSKHYHRITKLLGQGAWTLFLAGPRHKEDPGWGFIENGKFRAARADTAEGVSGDWLP